GLAEVSTQSEVTALVDAANSFLNTLSEEQRASLLYCLDDEELYSWTNIDVGDMPRTGGLEFSQLDETQLAAVYALFGAFLSAQGLEDVETIINVIEPATAEKYAENPDRVHGVDYYTVVVFGSPGVDGSWGVQLDGHHLAINFLVHGDQVTITPAFSGADPKVVGEVNAFEDEEAPAYALILSLTEDQLSQAVISDEVVRNIVTDNVGFSDVDEGRGVDLGAAATEGITAASLDAEQRRHLSDLIDAFVGDMDESLSADWYARIEAHIDETRFVYAGEVADDAGMYFRVYSPAVLIEYLHSNGETGHPHAMVRVLSADGDDDVTDYGPFASVDPLRQHLRTHPHHAQDRAEAGRDPLQQLLAMARIEQLQRGAPGQDLRALGRL
ncbi:MAG: DUF3500 domain-containing protein, partial [Alphaproteobacteria bacterium]|nr:DUF3500 domain-containing protein [Alphaproteobacteria bacterium]